jgi:hypothetical protein
MSNPALALTPVPTGDGTGAGANTDAARPIGHRHHAVRENTDGKQESGEPGRFAGIQWPGALFFPLSFPPRRLPASRRGRA